MDSQTTKLDLLTCECGSSRICISYSAPVFVYLDGGNITRVVVADDETQFSGVARCLDCDRFWVLDEEPEVGVWPAWQFGQ